MLYSHTSTDYKHLVFVSVLHMLRLYVRKIALLKVLMTVKAVGNVALKGIFILFTKIEKVNETNNICASVVQKQKAIKLCII